MRLVCVFYACTLLFECGSVYGSDPNRDGVTRNSKVRDPVRHAFVFPFSYFFALFCLTYQRDFRTDALYTLLSVLSTFFCIE